MLSFLAPQNSVHKWVGIIGLFTALFGPWSIYWNTVLGIGLAGIGLLSLATYLEFLPVLNRNFIRRFIQVLLTIILAILMSAYALSVFMILKK